MHLTRLAASLALATSLGAVQGCAYADRAAGLADDGLPSTKPYTVSAERRARVEANIETYFRTHRDVVAPIRLPPPEALARLLRQEGLITFVEGKPYWTNVARKASGDCTAYQRDTVYLDCRTFTIGRRFAKRGDFITARMLHLESAFDVFFRFYAIPTTPLGRWGSTHGY
jgi:hypothetical protein